MKKLNLYIIAWPCIHFAGAERWWYYVLKEIREMDINITLLIPTGLKLGCFKCPQELMGENLIVKYVPLTRDIKGILKGFSTILREAKHADIIVSGYQTPLITLLSALTGVLTAKKCFVMFHMPLGWIPYYQQIDISLRNKLLILLYKLINIKCKFIMVSPSVLYDHKRIRFEPKNVTSLSGAAVELPLHVQYMKPKDRKYDVIYLASISRAKGALDVPQILKYLQDSIGRIKAIIVGRISNDLRNELENELMKLNIRDNVEVMGYVDETLKFELLRSSKVMIYPSYIDTFAISVLEALTVGTPVVAYSIPAISVNYRTEAVRKVPIGDMKGMAEEVAKLLRDNSLLNYLSMEAINFAKKFTWRRIAIEFLRALTSTS